MIQTDTFLLFYSFARLFTCQLIDWLGKEEAFAVFFICDHILYPLLLMHSLQNGLKGVLLFSSTTTLAANLSSLCRVSGWTEFVLDFCFFNPHLPSCAFLFNYSSRAYQRECTAPLLVMSDKSAIGHTLSAWEYTDDCSQPVWCSDCLHFLSSSSAELLVKSRAHYNSSLAIHLKLFASF